MRRPGKEHLPVMQQENLVEIWLVRALAFFAMLFLYAGGIAPESKLLGPAALIMATVTLILCAIVNAISTKNRPDLSGAALTSLVMLSIGATGALYSTISLFALYPYTARDLGTIFFVLLTPYIMLFARRDLIISTLGSFAIGLALVDLVVNLLSVIGLIQLNEYSARVDEAGLRIRYPGLSGNTHASGLVLFIGLTTVFWRYRIKEWNLTATALITTALLFSSVLIDARRYTILALIGGALIFRPRAIRVPPVAIALAIGAVFLWATFNAGPMDLGNRLRGQLIEYGWYQAMQHPVVGAGISYRDPANLAPTFASLSQAGVTESMLIEFMRDFGVLFALCWVTGIAIGASRPRALESYPGIMLTLMLAELFFGGVLRGPLGSLMFYACYTYLITTRAAAPGPTSRPAASPASFGASPYRG